MANIITVEGNGADPAGIYRPIRRIGRMMRPQRTPGAVHPLATSRPQPVHLPDADGSGAGQLRNTSITSPVFTSEGKYSAMCMGIRTQPWLAGWLGTEPAPCTAMPPLKYTGL